MTVEESEFELRALLFDRIARSLAHCVGNASNVVAGRLSLLEMEGALDEQQAHSLKRTRERLYDLQQELQRALDFGGLAQQPAGQAEPVVKQLQAMQEPGVLTVKGTESCDGDQLPHPPIRGLSYLRLACRLGASEREVEWQVFRGADDARDIVLRVELGDIQTPLNRRALLEPWFSPEALEQTPEARYRRLILAQALGLLEDSGARFSAAKSQGHESAAADAIEVTWSRE